MSFSNHAPVAEDVLELAGFVLVHCALVADGNREGELICPFAVIQDQEGRDVVHFEADTQEEAVSLGWASLNEAQSNKLSWAFGREGVFRERDGTGIDVLTVSVWTPGAGDLYSLVQRFGRSEDQAIHLIGVTEVFRHDEGTATPVERWSGAALDRGIALHPRGSAWPAWRAQAR